ncbi:MAG: hypothetical protein RIT07_746 [Bacteroidota bacterium]
MLAFISHLTSEEQQIVTLSPVYVSLLIAGADGHFDTDEKKRIVELIHTKTFSERVEMQTLFRQLNADAGEQIRFLIASLPENTAERNQLLSDMIARLNDIFPKLDYNVAVQLYNSLRQFAHYIASADGGWWVISAVSETEKAFVKLPMLNTPEIQ